MSDQIGSAYVSVDADVAPAEAAFKKLQADADRTMADLGRKKAELEIQAKTTEFDREIDKVKVEIDNLKRKKASITIEGDTSQLDRDIAEAEAELKSLTGKKRKITIDSRDLRNTNRDAALLSKTMAVNEKLALDTAKANQKLTQSRQRDNDAILKSRVELDKLQASYEKLAGQRQKLERSSRGVFSGRSIAQSEQEARALSRVGNELDLTKNRIERLGGSVRGLDPALNKDRNRLENWFSSLSKVRLSLGPISGSLKQFAVAAGLLGPILFEVGGGLLSLVGVTGTALTGAMAAGAGAVAGFGLSALGVGLILKPVVSEIKAATDASTAYQKAVLKYGKNSTQAKTASEQLSHTLKGISPGARAAIKDFGGLSTTWKRLTKAARAPIFDAAAASIKTVKALLPSFARESVATTKVAAAGWEKWMAALRSPGAKSSIDQIMGNFRASLPSIMAGLQSLGTMIGHVATAGSSFLPGLSHGFADWAHSLEEAVGSGAQLESKLGRLIGHMRDIGHLAQASGRFLANFFNISADSGDNLVNALTKTINGWTKLQESTKGKNSLANFFSESEGATKDFFSSLGHLSELIFQISRATAPLANGFLKIVTYIGDVVSAADNLVGVKSIVQGLGFVLGGLFVASKVIAYGSAIKGVLVALGLMSAEASADVAATESLAVAQAELAAALTATAAAAVEADAALAAEGAIATEGALAATAAEAGAAGAALEGTAGSAGLLSAALAPEVLIPAGAVLAIGVLAANTEKASTSFERAGDSFREAHLGAAIKDVGKNTSDYNAVLHKNASAQHDVSEATQRLAKLYKEGAPASKQIKAARELQEAEHRRAGAIHEVGVANERGIRAAQQTLEAARQRVKAAKEEKQSQDALAHATGGKFSAHKGDAEAKQAEQAAKASRDQASAAREVVAAERQLNISMALRSRQFEGLKPLTNETVAGLEKLQKTIGQTATQKIANFVKPEDVKRVTDLSNKLTNLGRGSQVKNIDVKSHGADETISKLHQLQKQTKNVEGHTAKLTVKSNDSQANASLRKVAALSQRVTGSKQTIHILANSSSAEQALNRLRSHLDQVAHQKYQATMSAVDKTQPGWESAYHHLREKASTKYQAEITAVDKASGVAKKAEGGAKRAAGGHYQAQITASASQAITTIGFVQGQLAGLNGQTANTYVVTHYTHTGSPGGSGYSGGPYVPLWSGGAMSDQQMQRAYNQAGSERNGPSRKVNRPTMLVGEQPGHPEYVIATNPAYRADNERYLDQAASDLDKEVVPAYAKGKGKKKKKKGKGGGKGGGGAGPAPYKKQNKRHWTVHKHRFAPDSVSELNTAENTLTNEEHFFNAELEREEQEISHKKRSAWDFATLKGYLQREQGLEHKIIDTLIPAIASASNKAYNSADAELKGPLSAKNVHAAQHVAAAVEKEYSNMKAPASPTKKAGESTHDYEAKKKSYANAKQSYEHQKKVKKAQAKEADEYAKRLAKERGEAQQMKEDARQELTEVRQEMRAEHVASLKELQTQETGITDVEEHPEFAPYYEAANGGEKEPTIGEQTATLSAAREQLFNEFGSNIGGFGPAAAGTQGVAGSTGPAAAGASAAAYNAPPPAAGALAASVGAAPPPGQRGHHGPPSGNVPAAPGAGNVTSIVNNFAAPPPDPHTWSRQQAFEIAALT